MKTESKQSTKSRSRAASNKEVTDKLTEEAKNTPVNGKTVKPGAEKPKPEPAKVGVNLDDRIQNFEKLRGLANNRELLVSKLNELTKFNYNHDGSCHFSVRDANGLEFKTTNTNFIQLVTSTLQRTLEQRKQEIEGQIIQFEL